VHVLLDENLPQDLIDALSGHSVSTVHSRGWAGTRNGALLKRAGGVIDAFVTMDTNLEHQQNVAGLSFGIVVINALSNRIQDLTPLVPQNLEALNKVRPRHRPARWSRQEAQGPLSGHLKPRARAFREDRFR
jgi:predicted nuclease of predicted toxin-antitoxin system